jgi:hypothetical protein
VDSSPSEIPATPNVTLAPGSPTGPDADVLLRWRSHPVRQGGRRLVWVLAVFVIIPGALALFYGPFFGLLAFLMLAGSLGTYFLPTDYILTATGVESRFIGVPRRFRWEQFRSFYRDRHGVLLSPFPRPSRLENFRGLYLRFDGFADAVMAVVAARIIPPDAGSSP